MNKKIPKDKNAPNPVTLDQSVKNEGATAFDRMASIFRMLCEVKFRTKILEKALATQLAVF
jgi:hypothetical protein